MDRFLSDLRASLRNGELKAGAVLPPVKAFCLRYRLSRVTVIRGLRLLEQEGLLHARGRFRFAGRAEAGGSALSGTGGRGAAALGRHRPTVLCVVHRYQDWLSLWDDVGAGPFLEHFTDEVEKSGRSHRLFETGSEDHAPARWARLLLDRVKEAGPYGLGMVVFYHPRRFPDPSYLLRALAPLGLPVAFFNRSGSPPPSGPSDVSGLGGPGPARRAGKAPSRPARFYRFEPDEEGAVLALVRHLALEGHERIAYVAPEAGEWIRARGERLRQAWAASGRGFFRLVGPLSASPSAEEARKMMDWFRRFAPPVLRAEAAAPGKGASFENLDGKLRFFLLRLAPVAALLRENVTAFISPNDQEAARLLSFFRLAGVETPGEASVYGFDDSVQAKARGITSVDFGYRRMGYTAARLFTAQQKPPVGRGRMVLIEPQVIPRQSSGPPRRGPVRGRHAGLFAALEVPPAP